MSQSTFDHQRGPHLAAAQFAIGWDRAKPDRAGDYPEEWRERIERARAAGFEAEDPVQDRDYWRAWEAQKDDRAQSVSVQAALPEDPWAEEQAGPADALEAFFK